MIENIGFNMVRLWERSEKEVFIRKFGPSASCKISSWLGETNFRQGIAGIHTLECAISEDEVPLIVDFVQERLKDIVLLHFGTDNFLKATHHANHSGNFGVPSKHR